MKKLFYTTGICIALTFAACSNNRSEQTELAMADTASLAPDLSQSKAKLVKTADIDFQVKDVRKSSSNIHQIVKTFGGLVVHNDIQTMAIDRKTIPVFDDSLQLISSYRVEAQMTARVPSESLTDFVQAVVSDATVIYSTKLDIDDRSIDYLGSTLKQQSRKKILDKELKKDTLQTDKLLQLADEQDGIIDRKMTNLRTDVDVRYSTISLHFIQNTLVKKENVANNNLNVYQAPVYKRFANASSTGLNFFLNIIIGMVYIWPFILLGIGGWVGYGYVQRKSGTSR